jgi:hypothetical protein
MCGVAAEAHVTQLFRSPRVPLRLQVGMALPPESTLHEYGVSHSVNSTPLLALYLSLVWAHREVLEGETTIGECQAGVTRSRWAKGNYSAGGLDDDLR